MHKQEIELYTNHGATVVSCQTSPGYRDCQTLDSKMPCINLHLKLNSDLHETDLLKRVESF